MQPTLTTPDTLILAIWHEAGQAAIMGTLRSTMGALRADALLAAGSLWPAVAAALHDAVTIKASGLLIVSNDAALVTGLRSLRPPAPDKVQKVFVPADKGSGRKGGYLDVPYGGDPNHWRVIALLATVWAGRFATLRSSTLPKARTLWQQHCSPK